MPHGGRRHLWNISAAQDGFELKIRRDCLIAWTAVRRVSGLVPQSAAQVKLPSADWAACRRARVRALRGIMSLTE